MTYFAVANTYTSAVEGRMNLTIAMRWAWVGAIAGASAYALAWGAVWLTGDRSAFVSRGVVRVDQPGEVVASPMVTSYPGVLFGGLPPVPSIDATIIELGAVVLGIVGIAIAGVCAIALGRTQPRVA